KSFSRSSSLSGNVLIPSRQPQLGGTRIVDIFSMDWVQRESKRGLLAEVLIMHLPFRGPPATPSVFREKPATRHRDGHPGQRIQFRKRIRHMSLPPYPSGHGAKSAARLSGNDWPANLPAVPRHHAYGYRLSLCRKYKAGGQPWKALSLPDNPAAENSRSAVLGLKLKSQLVNSPESIAALVGCLVGIGRDLFQGGSQDCNIRQCDSQSRLENPGFVLALPMV